MAEMKSGQKRLGKSSAMVSLDVAFQQAENLLALSPLEAAEQALAILQVVPSHPRASLIHGVALRLSGQTDAAIALLGTLARCQPRSRMVWLELAKAALASGKPDAAIEALRKAVGLDPNFTDAWLLLAETHSSHGENEQARVAWALARRSAAADPEMIDAALALCDDDLATAEKLLRARLKRAPTHIAAIRMLGERLCCKL